MNERSTTGRSCHPSVAALRATDVALRRTQRDERGSGRLPDLLEDLREDLGRLRARHGVRLLEDEAGDVAGAAGAQRLDVGRDGFAVAVAGEHVVDLGCVEPRAG